MDRYTHGMLSGHGPVLYALSSRPPYPRHWYSYVVLPQPRFQPWWGEKLMAPKTVPSLKAMGVPPVLSREEVIRRMRKRRSTNMSVHDAEPGDVYVDEAGKLWRCVLICREPTVTMDEVEVGDNNLAVNGVPARARSSGGVSGLMWNGWKRIWRKEEPKPKADIFSRPECIFSYCPNPELCTTACLTPLKQGG